MQYQLTSNYICNFQIDGTIGNSFSADSTKFLNKNAFLVEIMCINHIIIKNICSILYSWYDVKDLYWKGSYVKSSASKIIFSACFWVSSFSYIFNLAFDHVCCLLTV